MLRWLPALAVLAGGPLVAHAQPSGEAAAEASASPSGAAETETAAPDEEAAESASVSHGVPDRGRLTRGEALTETPHLFVRISRRSAHYGTAELVGLIQRAADEVWERHPGPKLVVGDLSRPRGGRNPPHRSHQSGRDADVSIFVTDLDGASVEPSRFVALAPTTGCGRDEGGTYCLDPRRTFLFIVALLEDEVAQVRFVLIAADLRQLVLAAGRRADVSDEMLRRVEEVTALRDGSASHRSHLHVRIECPADDRGCGN
ncbi:MAG: penicillin-insensitive murein endopeptidase [Myxococcales bacterium]|nr:penicillin-insensitive murein endopeptidase [Myxococcales bacterium]